MLVFFSCMLLFLHLEGTRVLDLFGKVLTPTSNFKIQIINNQYFLFKFGEAMGPHNINVTETHGGNGARVGFGFGNSLPDVPGAQLLPDIVNVRYFDFLNVNFCYGES